MAQLAKDNPDTLNVNTLVETIMKNLPAQTGGVTSDELYKLIKGDDKGNKHQSYGLTQNDMKRIKEQQMLGKVETMSGNKVTRYKLPVYEKDLIHFTTEKVTYKQDTDIKTSKPRFHVKSVADFEKMSKTVKGKDDKVNPENAFAGLRVVILHDPRKGAVKEEKAKELSEDELMNEMNEGAIRQLYVAEFGEEAMPTDTKAQMIELIREKRESEKLA